LHIGTAALVTTSSITSSRSGTFTGSPSGIDTNSSANTASFSGNFSGVGALQIQGGGTVVFTGTNSYQGGTTVTASSTLSGNTNGVQGNIILDGPNTLLKFTQTFDGTYGGVISDGAAGIKQLTKEGTGKVTFTGSSPSFTGTTTVSAGSLIVNGSIANSPVNVFVGALLGGTGTVGPTTNAGILSPGNSIGTLTINGPLILTNSSTVVIETSPLTSDLISVTGTAFIDGNLTVTFEPGFYGLGTTYTIVTASGGFPAAPGFDLNTIDISSNFTPTLIYSGNNLLLSVTTLQPFFEFPYSNQNTQAVGENINALTQGGQLTSSLTNAIQSLVGDSFSSVNAVLDEMHPAPYSAFTEFQAESGGQLISLFHRPAYLSCGYQRDNRLWLEPFGNTLTVKNHGIQVGFQANSGGIALGGDCQYSEHVALGWGGAWNFTRLNWRKNRGNGEINGFYGSLYSDFQVENLYLGATCVGGVDFYDTSRHITISSNVYKAAAKYRALDIMAQFATAYFFGSPYAHFYPYANVDFLYLATPKVQESGAPGLNLTIHSRNDMTLRSEMGLGMQLQDANSDDTVCISPKISFGWVNISPIQRKLYSSHFESTTIDFETKGWDQVWNLLSLDFGLSLTIHSFSVGLKYNVEMSADAKTLLYNQHGDLNLSWSW